MDLDAIMTAVGNFGFPIAACVFLGWLTYTQSKTLGSFEDSLKEVAKTLDKINDRIEVIEDSIRKN